MSLKGLLASDGKNSSMRFNLILSSVGAFILMLAAAVYIVISAVKANEPSWEAIGVFAVGVAAIITGAGFVKSEQKKSELKYKEDEKKS